MAMLDDVLKQAQPGVNPQLEEMITTLMRNGGASPGQTQSGVQGLQGPRMQGTMATGVPGAAGQPGATPPMDPAEANQTLRILIQKGVPPAVAQQAIQNPAMLKELLAQIFKQSGPQEQPQAMASSPGRVSAPPLGGGGGY
jgi:hypothetical protein